MKSPTLTPSLGWVTALGGGGAGGVECF